MGGARFVSRGLECMEGISGLWDYVGVGWNRDGMLEELGQNVKMWCSSGEGCEVWHCGGRLVG